MVGSLRAKTLGELRDGLERGLAVYRRIRCEWAIAETRAQIAALDAVDLLKRFPDGIPIEARRSVLARFDAALHGEYL